MRVAEERRRFDSSFVALVTNFKKDASSNHAFFDFSMSTNLNINVHLCIVGCYGV